MTGANACGAIALGLATLSCGGAAAPHTPAPMPSPTPPPRVTFSLETAADFYRFSPLLARLDVGQSFEVTFKPVRINEAPDERFGHAVEFWVFQSITPPSDLDTDGFGVSFVWAGGGDWTVSSRKPVEGFTHTGLRVHMELGAERLARVTRRGDGALEFFLDGGSVLTLSDIPPAGNVFARVVGTTADFSYLPVLGSSIRFIGGLMPAQPCLICPSPHEASAPTDGAR